MYYEEPLTTRKVCCGMSMSIKNIIICCVAVTAAPLPRVVTGDRCGEVVGGMLNGDSKW